MLTYARAKLLSLVARTDFSMIRLVFATGVNARTLNNRDTFTICVQRLILWTIATFHAFLLAVSIKGYVRTRSTVSE